MKRPWPPIHRQRKLSIEADENHVRNIGVRLSIEVADLLAAKVSATPAAGGDQLDMFGGKA